MKILYFLSLLLCFACGSSPTPELKLGDWGADLARLSIQSNSWFIEFDCAHAKVNQAVVLKSNTFEIEADYFREAGVYTDDPEFHKAIPAIIKGELDGEELSLTFYVGEDLDNYGTFVFVWNQEAWLYKCA